MSSSLETNYYVLTLELTYTITECYLKKSLCCEKLATKRTFQEYSGGLD